MAAVLRFTEIEVRPLEAGSELALGRLEVGAQRPFGPPHAPKSMIAPLIELPSVS